MPTYDYKCSKCSHAWEVFQSIKADPVKKCPECKKNGAQRVITGGGGVLFKGGGFYETDYRSDGYKKAAKADADAAKPASETKSGGGKSDSKPAKGKSKDD